MKPFFIVGYMRPDSQWEFVGLFDDREAAVAACLDELFFVAPANLNEITPAEKTSWPGAEFPKANK